MGNSNNKENSNIPNATFISKGTAESVKHDFHTPAPPRHSTTMNFTLSNQDKKDKEMSDSILALATGWDHQHLDLNLDFTSDPLSDAIESLLFKTIKDLPNLDDVRCNISFAGSPEESSKNQFRIITRLFECALDTPSIHCIIIYDKITFDFIQMSDQLSMLQFQIKNPELLKIDVFKQLNPLQLNFDMSPILWDDANIQYLDELGGFSKSIEKLDIFQIKILNQDIHRLFSQKLSHLIQSRKENLKSLRLEWYDGKDQFKGNGRDLQEVFDALSKCSILQHLSLKVGQKQIPVESLSNALGKLAQLTELDIETDFEGQSIIFAGLKEARALKLLKIDLNNKYEIRECWNYISQFQSLEELRICERSDLLDYSYIGQVIKYLGNTLKIIKINTWAGLGDLAELIIYTEALQKLPNLDFLQYNSQAYHKKELPGLIESYMFSYHNPTALALKQILFAKLYNPDEQMDFDSEEKQNLIELNEKQNEKLDIQFTYHLGKRGSVILSNILSYQNSIQSISLRVCDMTPEMFVFIENFPHLTSFCFQKQNSAYSDLTWASVEFLGIQLEKYGQSLTQFAIQILEPEHMSDLKKQSQISFVKRILTLKNIQKVKYLTLQQFYLPKQAFWALSRFNKTPWVAKFLQEANRQQEYNGNFFQEYDPFDLAEKLYIVMQQQKESPPTLPETTLLNDLAQVKIFRNKNFPFIPKQDLEITEILNVVQFMPNIRQLCLRFGNLNYKNNPNPTNPIGVLASTIMKLSQLEELYLFLQFHEAPMEEVVRLSESLKQSKNLQHFMLDCFNFNQKIEPKIIELFANFVTVFVTDHGHFECNSQWTTWSTVDQVQVSKIIQRFQCFENLEFIHIQLENVQKDEYDDIITMLQSALQQLTQLKPFRIDNEQRHTIKVVNQEPRAYYYRHSVCPEDQMGLEFHYI